MSYRLRTLLKVSAGLALALALGLYAYFGVHREKEVEQRRELESRLVFDFSKGQVQRLELLRPSGKPAAVERQAKGPWRLVQPVEAEADALEVEGLLSTFASMTSKQRLPAENVGRYGLERPTATWRLQLSNGKTLELRVGKSSSYNQDLYAQRADRPDEVLVLEAYLAPQLLRHGADLRQRKLMPLTADQIGRLKLELGEKNFLLEKREGRWHLMEPVEDRADEQRVHRLLNLLGNLQATRFIDGDFAPRSYGLDAPVARVQVARQGERDWSYVFDFGRGTLKVNDKKFFVRRSLPEGVVAQVPDHVLSGLKVDRFGLQAKNPLDFQAGRVHQIKISGAGGLLMLERGEGKDSAWSLVAPLPGPAKSYKILSMLESLRRLKAKRFLAESSEESRARYGLDSPALGLWLMDEKGKEIGRLSVGSALEDGVAVLGSHRPRICLVPKKAVEKIPRDADELAMHPAQKP